jgi:hypothetical protein
MCANIAVDDSHPVCHDGPKKQVDPSCSSLCMSTKILHNRSLLKKNQEERIEETMTVTTSSRDVEKWKKGARVWGGEDEEQGR